MELSEMRKIWDSQNNRLLYIIDEKLLHNRIQSKMKSALLFANIIEWGLIIIYLCGAGFLIAFNSLQHIANVCMCIEATWMVATVVYVVVHRLQRFSSSRHFNRYIHGDLDRAISIATYQLRLARIMSWNILPLGAIMLFSSWEAGQLIKVGILILVVYGFAIYAGIKGNRANVRRRRELQVLKEQLETGY